MTPDQPKPPSAPLPSRLFRTTDWLASVLTFTAVFIVYCLTLGPEVTLEDSGELVTGSMYAGIPHPPGYPVWTIYSWLWTVLLPIGNMAWRVAVGQAFSGAVACGLIALLVSRGSSMFMEGIEELKSMTGRWESAICIIAGFVAGLLVGLDGFMWSESIVVNRIAVFSVPWMLLVLVCLLRWTYAPHQLRYAYLAAFVFGICMTTHQSLIVAALAFEVTLAAGNPKLGRDAFLGNFVLYLAYNILYFASGHHLIANLAKPGLYFLFNVVGLGSLAASVWLAIRTKGILSQWKHVAIMAGLWLLGVSFYLYMPLAGMTNPPMQWGYPRTVDGFFHALSRGQYEQPSPTNLLAEPGRFASQLWMLIEGVSEEFNWVYMLIALVPFAFSLKMQKRERVWLISLSAMYLCLGLLLMILLNPSDDRGSRDLIKVFLTSSHTIIACLIGYGLALIAAFMATNYNRFRRWGLAGGLAAVVLALYCLFDVTGKHYFGPAGQLAGLLELPRWVARAFAKDQYGLPVFACLVLLALTVIFVSALFLYRRRAPLLVTLAAFAAMPLYSVLSHWRSSDQHGHMFGYWFGHDMFVPPFKSPDGSPIYPPMTKDAILFGGTDPGRFCPTYMIFCESFTPHPCQPPEDQRFDRRDVYIITQNALADGTYLSYIRAHYNRSAQIDPPFFQDLLRSTNERKQNDKTNLLARAISPLDRLFTALGDRIEKRRRTATSWFKDDEFLDLSALAARLLPGPRQDPFAKYLFDNLSPGTRQLLTTTADPNLLRSRLAYDFNVILDQGPGLDLARFKEVPISDYLAAFVKQDPKSHSRVRLNRLLLEAAFPGLIAPSLGGLYPDLEIAIPSPDDAQNCYTEYLIDARKRFLHDAQFPNEPKQVKLGEDIRPNAAGASVQINGTVAIMSINALLTKIIFERNPHNEFFVEESFPLDWMYPHLTPYGIIMKVNRRPVPELGEDILWKDHDFWSQYSQRLIGNWITYDTPLQDIVAFVEKVYLRRDFSGFTGDRKFIHDDQAQKAFSKLRSAIAGVYAWRLNDPASLQPAARQRLIKEADFAFRQAFAFCPYSPEAFSRYINFLLPLRRYDDALLVASTCRKLDPFNGQVIGVLNNLRAIKDASLKTSQAPRTLDQLEKTVHDNPSDFQAAFDLAGAYLQLAQTNRALQILDGVLDHPNVEANALRALLQAYTSVSNLSRIQASADKLQACLKSSSTNFSAALGLAEACRLLQKPAQALQTLDQLVSHPQVDAGSILQAAQLYAVLANYDKLLAALEKLTRLAPDNPEAWYDLAALRATLGKPAEAIAPLRRALELSALRLKQNPKARDLLSEAQHDSRFAQLAQNPEFKQLTSPKP